MVAFFSGRKRSQALDVPLFDSKGEWLSVEKQYLGNDVRTKDVIGKTRSFTERYQQPGKLLPRVGTYARLPNGLTIRVIPRPTYCGLTSWIWRRLIGWRDDYDRPAQLVGWKN